MKMFPLFTLSFCLTPPSWFLSHFRYFGDDSFDIWVYIFFFSWGGRVCGVGVGVVQRAGGLEQATVVEV